MTTRMVISYQSADKADRQSSFTYYLATREDMMRFYLFDEPKEGMSNQWTLISELDRRKLLGAGNKDTAKAWAKRLGLKNWTYVRI